MEPKALGAAEGSACQLLWSFLRNKYSLNFQTILCIVFILSNGN